MAARKGQFSGQNLLIGDLLTLTNTHLKFSSFDDHRFGVKENNSIRATFWIQFEDSGTSPDELLHFMFLTCHIPISSPIKISLTWVGCILSLSLWSNPCSHFPGVPLLLLLTGHGGVQPYLCDFLFLQCSLWLLFSVTECCIWSWISQAGMQEVSGETSGSYKDLTGIQRLCSETWGPKGQSQEK